MKARMTFGVPSNPGQSALGAPESLIRCLVCRRRPLVDKRHHYDGAFAGRKTLRLPELKWCGFICRVAGRCGGGPAHPGGAAGARLRPGRQMQNIPRGDLQRQDETGLQRARTQGPVVRRDAGEPRRLHLHIGDHRWILFTPPAAAPALYSSLSPPLQGLPKAAPVSHAKVWAMASMAMFTGVTSKDVIYIPLPLYHSAGFLGCTSAIDRGSLISDHTSNHLLFLVPLKVKRSLLCRVQG